MLDQIVFIDCVVPLLQSIGRPRARVGKPHETGLFVSIGECRRQASLADRRELLVPIGYLSATGFISAFFLLDIMMGAWALDRNDLAMMFDHNFALSLGVAIVVMSALVVGIYLLSRNSVNGEIYTNYDVLSGATATVLYAAFIITFGGMAELIAAAALVLR